MFRLLVLVVLFSIGSGCSGCDDDSGALPGSDAGNNSQDMADDANNQADGGPSDMGEPDEGSPDMGEPDANTCSTVECNGVCCAEGQECFQDLCLDPCAGTRCGAGFELCCAESDICLGQACLTPGANCTVTEECAVEEICEPTVGKCVPRDAVEVCEFIPPIGPFEPEVGCYWPNPAPTVNPDSIHVVVAPIVGNLTDDNGDGLTNTDDVPEIVFLTRTNGCCDKRGTLRIVDGRCGENGEMTTIASLDSVVMTNDAAPALGDLDGDGVPEIVAVKGQNLQSNQKVTPQGLVAWKRVTPDGSTWEPMWENDQYPTFGVHTRGGPTVGIADLDGDGNPEVFVGNVVLNGQDGTLKWDGVANSQTPVGIGNNAFLGPSSIAADVDLDGMQEIMAGNTLYSHDGTVRWTYEYTTSNSTCQGSLPCDGYTAVAEFDGDPEGEIVIIRLGEVFVLNHDGSLFWQQQIVKDDCTRNESGPPTIADFDGDGRPEIGTAAADFYTVLDLDCDTDTWEDDGCFARGVLWATPNQDCSSRVTASSVFDFEGDGKAEMVYADEQNFRIFDGTTGAILFDDPSHSSNTRIEMPIVADVDNDGNSEIVVPSATAQSIKVFKDPSDNWVRTRRIWNQHAYAVTNINEDGTVPAQPDINWLNGRLNNFRQNIQPGGIFDAPNLLIESVDVRGLGCGEDSEVIIRVTVSNAGALGVAPGNTLIRIYGSSGGNTTVIDDTTLTTRLLPGQREVVEVTYAVPADWVTNGFEIGAIIDPDATINECNEDDNQGSFDGANVVFSAPELEVTSLTATGTTCGLSLQMPIEFTVRNSGTDTVPANVPLVVTATFQGTTVEVARLTTSAELLVGEEEDFNLTWAADPRAASRNVTITVTVDPDKEVYDCDEQEALSVVENCRISG